MSLPETLWIRRRVLSQVEGAPDIDLDSLNLMEAPVDEIRWWGSVSEIPLDLDLTRNLVHCDIRAMRDLQYHLGLEPFLEADTYPDCLRPFLGREVRKVPDVVAAATRGSTPLFLKPSVDSKAFTGFVMTEFDDILGILHCEGVEGWVSEVVDWAAEWRVLVCEGEVVAVRNYKGDGLLPVPADLVREVVQAGEGILPDGYCLDVGLIRRPAGLVPALVEFNSGYAFGAYEAESTAFCRTLWSWWRQNVRRG